MSRDGELINHNLLRAVFLLAELLVGCSAPASFAIWGGFDTDLFTRLESQASARLAFLVEVFLVEVFLVEVRVVVFLVPGAGVCCRSSSNIS